MLPNIAAACRKTWGPDLLTGCGRPKVPESTAVARKMTEVKIYRSLPDKTIRWVNQVH